ncbi:MAG: hypothetical protein PHU27_13290, partial [Salinivirgaceae bacterium]|nr:hypothetical protein [Salinivirgaceae bacterium]
LPHNLATAVSLRKQIAEFIIAIICGVTKLINAFKHLAKDIIIGTNLSTGVVNGGSFLSRRMNRPFVSFIH